MSQAINSNVHWSKDKMPAINNLPPTGKFASKHSSGKSYVTPDSSVSPGIEPRSLKGHHRLSPESEDEIDDLDMDGIDGSLSRADASVACSSPILDSSGARLDVDPAIAPATLADVYLPSLFAEHGPCAIRHLTQFLSINNPRFAELPAGKQRRLIVKALELGKGTMFEKVGWGRWNQIEGRNQESLPFTPETLPQHVSKTESHLGSSLKHSVFVTNSVGNQRPPIMGSYPLSSYSSHQDFMFSPSLSVAETSREDEDDVDIDPLDLDLEGEDSETDEEDWKSIGPEALRARSVTASNAGSYRESGSYLGSYTGSQRSGPYPIRRKSTAGVYQLNTTYLQPGSHSSSPMLRPSFPKTSSYLKSSPMSNARASSFSRAREQRSQQISPNRSLDATLAKSRQDNHDTQADAIEALVMLSGSYDAR